MRRVHYVLSTHWDREWLQTFQDFRYRLVGLLDRVLAGLGEGRLRGPFQTDGQAIILEDYLEIRPECRPQIASLLREGKLVAGPWYVLPDEFTVSGESLVRNLRRGRELVRALGGLPSQAGFVCDMFGHHSQLPQIFAGFGLQGVFLWRGLNVVEHRNLRWRGADGTELPCYRFGSVGYCSYGCQVRQGGELASSFDAARAARDLEAFLAEEARRTEVDPILLFDGCDHHEWDEQAYPLIASRLDQRGGEYEFVHSSLDGYLAEMAPQAGRISTLVEGELREPGRHPGAIDCQTVIPGVLSSRVPLKQANCRCQALLCQWAEPFSAFAHQALGTEYPRGFLEVAWRWLLQNHPHDSIDGCSIDQVHEDMTHRFDQCHQIAHRLAEEATRQLAASVPGEVGERELRVAVFNPLPRDREQVVELTLPIPAPWPTFNEFFGFEPKPAFRIYGPAGEEIPYQRLAQAMHRTQKRLRPLRFPQAYAAHNVTVALPLPLPALGYTTLTVRAGEGGLPTRYPDTPSLVTSERSMANQHLAVQVEPNGTLTVTDRRTGETYQRLLTFEDAADIGDGWYHGQAVNDQVFVSTASPCQVALVHSGPLLAAFRLRTVMAVPARFCFDRMTRSQKLVELVLDSLVTLRAGQPYLDVHTTVENAADDHRLRLLLPSGAAARTYLADTPFDVVERPLALRPDNHQYRELEVETKPQQSWTAVQAGRRGLAVVSAGLLESAVRDLPEAPIALTLYRGTRRTAFTDGEPGGQLRGRLEFDYRILPLAGPPDRRWLCELGQELAAGLRAVPLQAEDLLIYRTATALPPSASFLRVKGDAVTTSVQQVGEGLEVRLFNPTGEPIKVQVEVGGGAWRRVQRVDLESNPLGPPRPSRGRLRLTLAPKQIITLRLT